MITNTALIKRQRRAGLNGCGLGALDLAINKSAFVVGEAPGYTVSGAAINSPVLWNSTKNGLPTGENLSDYGHKTDGVGVWSSSGGAWLPEHQGYWTKTVSVGGETDTVSFQVLPQSGNQPLSTGGSLPRAQVAQSPQSEGWLTGDFDLGGYKIPKIAAYAAIGFLAFTMLGKRR